MLSYGVKDIVGFDRQGALSRDRDYDGNVMKQWFADNTNPKNVNGSLTECIEGADFVLGLAGPDLLTREQVASMSNDAIVSHFRTPTLRFCRRTYPITFE